MSTAGGRAPIQGSGSIQGLSHTATGCTAPATKAEPELEAEEAAFWMGQPQHALAAGLSELQQPASAHDQELLHFPV
eukprot:CAMPEP_0184315208 /NCGR_PEP_ID=MMETSP1049-20130417/80720_1 /TAXON_ID=77928 /ORGANISM="Proteomonas sulcata, Strain CCMP704" /LENGTH=76 /DNA_ID=CAMNT_0026633545 /DNA_START=707 /DNA_END=938 /DNA_ORIENTATION=+